VPRRSFRFSDQPIAHQAADFLEGLRTGKPCSPTFREALETTKVCDAILKSGASGKWVGVR
jgi:predicted dehydrogenase